MDNPLWIVAALVHSAAQVPRADAFSASDPFVVMRVHAQSVRTPTIQDDESPRWDAPLHLVTRDSLLPDLRFELWDEDPLNDELLAVGALPPERLRAAFTGESLPLVLLPDYRQQPAGPPTLRLSCGLVRAYGALRGALRKVSGVLEDDDQQAVEVPAMHPDDGLRVVATYHGDRVALRALQAPRAQPCVTFLEWALDDAEPLPFTQRAAASAAAPWADPTFNTLTVAEAVTAPLHPSLPLERLTLRRLTASPTPAAVALASDLLADAGWPAAQPLSGVPYAHARAALPGALLDDLNHMAYLPQPDALYALALDTDRRWLFAPAPAPRAHYHTLRDPSAPADAPATTARVHLPRPRAVHGFWASQTIHPPAGVGLDAPLLVERYTLSAVESFPLLSFLPLR